MISLEIKDIYFGEGKLWKPRYPSLINYDFAPDGFQFEPAFQTSTEEVEVRFQIADDQPVVFAVKEDGTANLQPLAPLTKDAVEVTVDPGRKVCRAVWTRGLSGPIASLRIVCHRLLGGEDSDDGALNLVEGGVYLAIIGSRKVSFPHPAQKEAGPPPQEKTKVRLLGFDEDHRAVYDLFHAGAAPPALELEPAFRVAHGEQLDLPIALDLPEYYRDLRFKTTQEQVDMSYWQPDWKPAHLERAEADEEGLKCTIQWRRPPCTCTEGRTASFSAQLQDSSTAAGLRIDPTVIEPPACDASGVCTPPRPPHCEGSGGRQPAEVGV